MFLRKYWLPISVFLIVIVGIGLYLLATQPPKKPIVIYKAVEPDKPTEQPTTEAPVGEQPQEGGHVHADGTWHEGAHKTPIVGSESPTGMVRPPIGSSGEFVTKEHIAKMREFYASLGLDPPPPGYDGYIFDENGNVIKPYKYNVPEFEVKWAEEESPGNDYSKLTQEEWKRHHALRHIVSQTPLRLTQEHEKILRAGGPFPTVTYAPGVVELAKEKIRELDEKASGRHPVGGTSVTWSRPPTDKELEAIARKEYELLQELASQKPQPPPPTGWTDETYFYGLVRELEAEAERR